MEKTPTQSSKQLSEEEKAILLAQRVQELEEERKFLQLGQDNVFRFQVITSLNQLVQSNLLLNKTLEEAKEAFLTLLQAGQAPEEASSPISELPLEENKRPQAEEEV